MEVRPAAHGANHFPFRRHARDGCGLANPYSYTQARGDALLSGIPKSFSTCCYTLPESAIQDGRGPFTLLRWQFTAGVKPYRWPLRVPL